MNPNPDTRWLYEKFVEKPAGHLTTRVFIDQVGWVDRPLGKAGMTWIKVREAYPTEALVRGDFTVYLSPSGKGWIGVRASSIIAIELGPRPHWEEDED